MPQKTQRRFFWLLLAFALLGGMIISLSACAPGGASPNTSLGTAASSSQGTVEGVVMQSPTCPVVQADHPCPPRPVPHRVVLFTLLKGGGAAQVTTDQNGKFTLELAPGTYTVRVTQTGPFPIQRQPQQVTVVAGQTVQIQVILDGGIR